MIDRMRGEPTGLQPDRKQAPPNGGFHCRPKHAVGREILVPESGDGPGEHTDE